MAPYLGAAATVACVGFLGWRVSQLAAELAPYFRGWGTLLGLLALAVVYALSLFLVAWTWVLLVPRAPAAAADRDLLRAYGVTSIAKYLPGNVFHFAGRQIAGARLGLSHAAMARATAVESLLSVAMALAVGLAFATFAPTGDDTLRSRPELVAASVVVLVAVSLWFAARRFRVAAAAGAVAPRAVLLAASCAAVFFCVSALIAIAADHLLRQTTADAAAIGAAYLFAWTVGYVVPGAPGGLGVREATLLGLLASTAVAPGVVALALATRLVTTVGDALFAALCVRLPARPRPPILEE